VWEFLRKFLLQVAIPRAKTCKFCENSANFMQILAKKLRFSRLQPFGCARDVGAALAAAECGDMD
jgi:hypothetical protein